LWSLIIWCGYNIYKFLNTYRIEPEFRKMHETKLNLNIFAIKVQNTYSLGSMFPWLESNSSTMVSSSFSDAILLVLIVVMWRYWTQRCYAKMLCEIEMLQEGVVQSCWMQQCCVQAIAWWNVSKNVDGDHDVHNENFLNFRLSCFFSGKYVTISFYKKMLKDIGVNLKLNVNVTPTLNTFVTCTCMSSLGVRITLSVNTMYLAFF
jgi:hypothetical protein